MGFTIASLRQFMDFAVHLKGDEKGEAVLFVDRLMRAFGHEGSIEAGGTHEWRIKTDTTTKFADFVWPGHVLIEMKKRHEPLGKHYQQAFNYWLELVPDRPGYVILCNFDELWVYDLNRQLREPLQMILIKELDQRETYKALVFLEDDEKVPAFTADRVKVTKDAADLVASVYNSLVGTAGERNLGNVCHEVAQRYVLQCLVAFFSEDAGLLSGNVFGNLIGEAISHKSSYDLVGGLFRQMNDAKPATGGRYVGVDYFNGGLFSEVNPIELNFGEMSALYKASRNFDWSQIEPGIFGTLFQDSMGKKARHAYGAHYTSPIDIMKVVTPTIIRPWDRHLNAARSFEDLVELKRSLALYRVLDPACGSGNFLYVAYQELKAFERRLTRRMLDLDAVATHEALRSIPFFSIKQLFGMDVLPFAVELAKVTLMIAKELAIMNPPEDDPEVAELVKDIENPLPLDNMDTNILRQDALFDPWPSADAIIGNPPYQSKNKMQAELGPAKVAEIRERHPDIPGRADFCVYWFRLAHDHLKPGGRAGLVGTNTVRQNFSREGGLDHIVGTGGVILDAVSTQPWSGAAAVHVSIVNWVRRPSDEATANSRNPVTTAELAEPKRLTWISGDDASGRLQFLDLDHIGPALSAGVDVSGAVRLRTNMQSESCYQGQTHGHEGFLLTAEEAHAILTREPESRAVLFPYLTADEMLGFVPGTANCRRRSAHALDQSPLFGEEAPEQTQSDLLCVHDQQPQQLLGIDSGPAWFPERFVIDFGERDVIAASSFTTPFRRVRERVLPDREDATRKETERNKGLSSRGNQHHANFYRHWWCLSYGRQELMQKLAAIPRFIVCGRVTKRPIFVFVSNSVHPNDALAVFPLADDYAFGILQSSIHWLWFTARCSTLKADFRYTSDSVFDAFPWPQSPTEKQVRAVADAAVALRAMRLARMVEHGIDYRALYRTLEIPGKNPLRDAQDALDLAVRKAYGMPKDADILQFLLELNLECAAREANGQPITPPGLPAWITDRDTYVTPDCIHVAMTS